MTEVMVPLRRTAAAAAVVAAFGLRHRCREKPQLLTLQRLCRAGFVPAVSIVVCMFPVALALLLSTVPHVFVASFRIMDSMPACTRLLGHPRGGVGGCFQWQAGACPPLYFPRVSLAICCPCVIARG